MILCSRDGCFCSNLLKRHNPLAWARGSWRSFQPQLFWCSQVLQVQAATLGRDKLFFFVPTPMSLWNFSSWIYGINKFMNLWTTLKDPQEAVPDGDLVHSIQRKEFHFPMESKDSWAGSFRNHSWGILALAQAHPHGHVAPWNFRAWCHLSFEGFNWNIGIKTHSSNYWNPPLGLAGGTEAV